MKKRILVALLCAALCTSFVACGDNSSSIVTSSNISSVGAKAEAEEHFHSAISSLSAIRDVLKERISKAETLLADVTATDVSDANTIENLKNILKDAKSAQEIAIPDMESDTEKIQEQTKSVQEQIDNISKLCSSLDDSVSQVKTSQQKKEQERIEKEQERIDSQRRANATLKTSVTGKVSNTNGYEAEYRVSATDWIKASDTETLQIRWHGKMWLEKGMSCPT